MKKSVIYEWNVSWKSRLFLNIFWGMFNPFLPPSGLLFFFFFFNSRKEGERGGRAEGGYMQRKKPGTKETGVDETIHVDFTPSLAPVNPTRNISRRGSVSGRGAMPFPRLRASLPLSSSCEWMCAVPKSPWYAVIDVTTVTRPKLPSRAQDARSRMMYTSVPLPVPSVRVWRTPLIPSPVLRRTRRYMDRIIGPPN
jgi:hypothetical protein